VPHFKLSFMVLKLGHLGKYFRNISKVLECGAGEDQLNPLCEKWRNVILRHGGKERPTCKSINES